MPLIQFPDVKVEIKGPGSRNPFFVGALGVPLGGASEPLARAFAQAIEGTGLFYGATIDVIGNGIRGRDAWAHFDDIRLMDELISEFADPRNGLVYAVAIDNNAEGGAPLEKNKPYKAEKVLTTKKEMLDFWGSFDDAVGRYARVDRTAFVPSPRFTKQVFGFDYEPNQLERLILRM